MWKRKHETAHGEQQGADANTKRFVSFLAQVSYEQDHNHYTEIITARYGSTPGTSKLKPPLQCRHYDVDKPVNCGTLSQNENNQKQENSTRPV